MLTVYYTNNIANISTMTIYEYKYKLLYYIHFFLIDIIENYGLLIDPKARLTNLHSGSIF